MLRILCFFKWIFGVGRQIFKGSHRAQTPPLFSSYLERPKACVFAAFKRRHIVNSNVGKEPASSRFSPLGGNLRHRASHYPKPSELLESIRPLEQHLVLA